MGRDEFDRLRGKPPTERAASVLQYELYDFLVYPQIRPNDPEFEHVMVETIEEARKKLQPFSVLEGLTPRRQDELAALVIDFHCLHDMYRNYGRGLKLVREAQELLGKRGLRKLKIASKSLEELVKAFPNPHSQAPGFRLAIIAADLKKLIAEFETKVDVETFKEWMKKHFPSTVDPKRDATKQLFWFFVSKCGLAKNEAQVRVAKIGNDLFNWDISYRDKYEGYERWKGSTTIRQRIAGCPQRKARSNPKQRKKESAAKSALANSLD